jgi:hypothetical protein
MRRQSRRSKHAEAITNQVVGIAIGWAIVYWAFPFIGLETTATQATASSAIFFVASYARFYAIRSIFDRWG